MNIGDFFNPENPNHVRAYRTLQETGAWPKGFIPDDLEFNPVWAVDVINKLADCWVRQMLSQNKVSPSTEEISELDNRIIAEDWIPEDEEDDE